MKPVLDRTDAHSVAQLVTTWTIAACFVAGFSGVVGGCISDDEAAAVETACPSVAEFATLSPILERRCGSLDCHGDAARPFIVYGQPGLRRPGAVEDGTPGYVSGGSIDTTDHERIGTYQSLCGLEPQLMEEVVAQGEDPGVLTVVRKARLDEKHKGGRIWQLDSAGDKCLTSWLSGSISGINCQQELSKP